jgi:hypothetical protein
MLWIFVAAPGKQIKSTVIQTLALIFFTLVQTKRADYFFHMDEQAGFSCPFLDN